MRDGTVAGAVGTHGMHDVTEGGILGAIWEMCQIAGVGAEIHKDEVPVNPVTRKICDHYGINFMRLISSGSMIIMAPPEKKNEIIKKLEAVGVAASEIGRITDLSVFVHPLNFPIAAAAMTSEICKFSKFFKEDNPQSACVLQQHCSLPRADHNLHQSHRC